MIKPLHHPERRRWRIAGERRSPMVPCESAREIWLKIAERSSIRRRHVNDIARSINIVHHRTSTVPATSLEVPV